MIKWLSILILGLLGGTVGFIINFPLAVLLGALFFVGTVQILTNRLSQFSIGTKKVIQCIIGGSIGLTFTTTTFSELSSIWNIAIIVPLLQIIFSIFLTFILYKLFKIDIVTAICSSAPAGMSEITIISEEYGAEMPIVILIHTVRVITIVIGVPIIVNFI